MPSNVRTLIDLLAAVIAAGLAVLYFARWQAGDAGETSSDGMAQYTRLVLWLLLSTLAIVYGVRGVKRLIQAGNDDAED